MKKILVKFEKSEYSLVRPKFMHFTQNSSSAAPQILLCPRNVGIEPRTVAMLALAVGSFVDPDLDFFALEDSEFHSGFKSGS